MFFFFKCSLSLWLWSDISYFPSSYKKKTEWKYFRHINCRWGWTFDNFSNEVHFFSYFIVNVFLLMHLSIVLCLNSISCVFFNWTHLSLPNVVWRTNNSRSHKKTIILCILQQVLDLNVILTFLLHCNILKLITIFLILMSALNKYTSFNKPDEPNFKIGIIIKIKLLL